MDLKKLLIPILAFQMSCSFYKQAEEKRSASFSLANLVRREMINVEGVKPYRFETKNKKNRIPKFKRISFTKNSHSTFNEELFLPIEKEVVNNFMEDAEFPKTERKKINKPYRIRKRLLTNSHTNLLINKAVDKPIVHSGKLLKVSEQPGVNYEINMNKSHRVDGFNVESSVAKIEIANLINSVDWSAPAKAEKEAIAQREKLAKEQKVVTKVLTQTAVEKNLSTLASNILEESLKKKVEVAKSENFSTEDDLLLIDLNDDEEVVAETKKLDVTPSKNNVTQKEIVQDEVSSLMSVASRSISSSVTDVIAREMQKSPKKIRKALRERNRKVKKVITPREVKNPQDKVNGFFASKSNCGNRSGDSKMSIHGYSVIVGQKRLGKVHNFDFIPEYNRNDIMADAGQGCFDLPMSTQDGSVLRGTFSSQDEVLTKTDIFVDGQNLHVPLLTKRSLSDFLDKNEDYEPGSFVLVEMAENISSVEVAAKYSKKYFFNEFFQETEGDDVEFILFSGVQPGNISIQYLTTEDHIVDKIAHVVRDEVYYDMARVNSEQIESFYLYEDGLLSKQKRLLVEGDQIRFFNTDIKATQKALNLFEMKIPQTAKGMRKYFELGHLGEVIVMGKGKAKKVSLPNRRFIGQILTEMQLEDLMGRCLIQLNTKKAVKNVEVSGEASRGLMNIDYNYLDKEGNFGKFESDTIYRVFVTGEDQGVINAKLEYFDDKSEFIQTYCSNETYLVEQL